MRKLKSTKSFILFTLLALLQACASKPTTSSEGAGPGGPSAGMPGADGSTAPDASRRIDPKRVSLVLGGAGVASFATVGLLKKLNEEGIQVELIVSTGWPTLFALGYGFLKSVHDLEWFAMRLQDKDFYAKAGLFELNRDYATNDKISEMVESAFKQQTLDETRVPVVIAATNTDAGEPETYSSGSWKEPLLKTMSIPGIHRPYPQNDKTEWIASLQGMDVDEAMRRGARTIIAVQMYEDYFDTLKGPAKQNSEALFRRLYLTQMSKSIAESMKMATVSGRIVLKRGPTDFAAKRAAILAGYKEGARLARELRKHAAE